MNVNEYIHVYKHIWQHVKIDTSSNILVKLCLKYATDTCDYNSSPSERANYNAIRLDLDPA